MTRPKWTTRSLMIVVLGLAVMLGLSIPAFQAASDEERHCHSFIGLDPPQLPFHNAESTPTPFLFRYWRKLTGRPRIPGQDCGASNGQIEEVCALGHPEILGPASKGSAPLLLTPGQRTVMFRMAQEQINRR
jgi:hypothetical protein